MINARLLEEFKKQLDELVGAKFNGYRPSKADEKRINGDFIFSKPLTERTDQPYTLGIKNCAWQILRGDSVIFSYLLDANEKEKVQANLANLEAQFVEAVHFDTEDLSLLVRFKNDHGIKLLHNAEEKWKYSYMITSWRGYFVVSNNSLDELDLHGY